MKDKPIFWVGSSLDDVRRFPEAARQKVGFQLRAIRKGQPPSDFKPMPMVGAGVHELRIRTGEAWRVFYVARFEEAVYVLHAFQKKTRKTPAQDIQRGQKRYQAMLAHREKMR